MFRFFKKKPDTSEPQLSDWSASDERLQNSPETPVPEASVAESRALSDPDEAGPEHAPEADPAALASRPGLLSRWFKRNPDRADRGDEAAAVDGHPERDEQTPVEETLGEETVDEQALEAESLAASVVDAALLEQHDEPSPEFNDEDLSEQAGLDEAQQKSSWLAKLKGGLAKTGKSIGGLFVGVRVDEDLFEELETALIMADTGVEATEQLLVALRARVRQDRIEEAEGVKQALREVLAEHLRVLEKPFEVGRVKPLVVMMTGVNGAGKTTSIGKLAFCLQKEGARVLLAAGDTFRAAARQQLVEWGARNQVDVIAQDGGDPAAVAFDAVNAGRARGMDVVMVDTAGRLPTQLHLMDELKKIRRVIAKADPSAPHEVLLVVDGNQGQNVLSQIRAFDAAVGLTGLIVTKLDGTAKGGTLAAVAAGAQGVRPIPVYWIGVGERIEDLQPFVASEFAAAVVGQ